MRTVYMRTLEGAPISADSLARAMHRVREITFSVAAGLNTPVADIERAIDGRPEYFMDDFHLTSAGNELAAQTLLSVIRPFLDEWG